LEGRPVGNGHLEDQERDGRTSGGTGLGPDPLVGFCIRRVEISGFIAESQVIIILRPEVPAGNYS
jgi:hypothetical protein